MSELPYPDSCFTLCPFDPTTPELGQFITVHYRVWSRDELVNPYRFCLLVHGFAASTFSWREQVQSLLESHDMVIAVDLPGFGFSGRDRNLIHSDIRRAYWLMYIVRHIERLYDCSDNTYHWSLIGHGMGARVITALVHIWNQQQQLQQSEEETTHSTTTTTTEAVSSVNQRSKIENVILVSPENMGIEETNPTTMNLQNKMLGWFPTSFLPSSLVHALICQQSLMGYLLGKLCYNRSVTQEEVRGFLRPLTIPNTIQCFSDMIEFNDYQHGVDIRELYQSVPRLLIVCGTDDNVIPIESHVQLFSLLENEELQRDSTADCIRKTKISLQVVQDAGYNVMETHAQEFNQTVNNFCQFPQQRESNRAALLMRGASSQILTRVSSLFRMFQ